MGYLIKLQPSTQLRRVLSLRDLLFYGIILVQPTAPMPLFGVVSQEARGHVVTAVLIGMVAMMFTAVSYGRMARVHPQAGSAYTYVSRELHPGLGFLTGWSMILDYIVNPLICVIWCSKAAGNFVPWIPYWGWAVFFAVLFTWLNLRGVEVSARLSKWMAIVMGAVVALMFGYSIHYLMGQPQVSLLRPFYDPATFSWASLSTGTSIAVLTYIGFDAISTLSEEVENPRRNILLGTVLTCLFCGLFSAAEVYIGQLVWPDFRTYPDVDTAYVYVAGRAGGLFLFNLVNLTLLVASVGSGMGSQLAAARMLYGMGRDNVLPKRFFAALDPKRAVPRNNVLLGGALVLAGAFAMSYQLGAELLNFGAFIGFMGVNLAAFAHYWLRGKDRSWTQLVVPLAGFAVCLYIWLSLRTPAKIAGGAWLVCGAVYGTVRVLLARNKAGQGAGRGPGGPPYNLR